MYIICIASVMCVVYIVYVLYYVHVFCIWGEPEHTPVLLVEHGMYVACTKISCKNREAPHLVVGEMVRTSCAQKFPEQII